MRDMLGWYTVKLIRYDIISCSWVTTRWLFVQYTFTHKQYIEQHNRHKKYIEQNNSLIRKSANRAPSLRGIPWHLPYNWGESTGKPQSG